MVHNTSLTHHSYCHSIQSLKGYQNCLSIRSRSPAASTTLPGSTYIQFWYTSKNIYYTPRFVAFVLALNLASSGLQSRRAALNLPLLALNCKDKGPSAGLHLVLHPRKSLGAPKWKSETCVFHPGKVCLQFLSRPKKQQQQQTYDRRTQMCSSVALWCCTAPQWLLSLEHRSYLTHVLVYSGIH